MALGIKSRKGTRPMKNQYFGDINDFRKYALLRILIGMDNLRIAVCWMLTADDGGPDGEKIKYLYHPDRWMLFDQGLYEELREAVIVDKERNVARAESPGILPCAKFHKEILSDDFERRRGYFEILWETAEACDLVFFDPDNGMEIKSKPKGRKGSSKYLYWDELVEAYSRGYSVLVYQHFPRVDREHFITDLAEEMEAKTGAEKIYTFATPDVVFLLSPSKKDTDAFEERSSRIAEVWGDQIGVQRHDAGLPPQDYTGNEIQKDAIEFGKDELKRWAEEEQMSVEYTLAPSCPVCGGEMSSMPGLGSRTPEIHLEGDPVSKIDPEMGDYSTDCVVWELAFMCMEESCAAEITISHTMQVQYPGDRPLLSSPTAEILDVDLKRGKSELQNGNN